MITCVYNFVHIVAMAMTTPTTWPPPSMMYQYTVNRIHRTNLNITYLKELNSPMVFKGMIQSWFSSLTWTQEEVSNLLADVVTTFKVCPKKNSSHYKTRFPHDKVVFETDL